MKLSFGFATLALLLAAVEASSVHNAALIQRRAHARDVSHHVERCDDGPATPDAHNPASSGKPAQGPPPSGPPGKPASLGQPAHGPPSGPSGNPSSGIIKPSDAGKCNPVGATAEVTSVSGPNGHIDWLNCGVNGAGWAPAPVKINEIVVAELDGARHTTFATCSDQIIATFKQCGQELGIPPILLASFAMQESFCNPNAVGGAGEQGLMQITPEKCKGAPNGNCKDVEFNIRTAAAFFNEMLHANGGDIILTVGRYNGWAAGMTYGAATKMANTCCRCQNNLDYVHQFLNGWAQGVNAYEKGLGKYHNVDHC
ncbi:lysozyme-like domain-containing protein [Russula brevipes]|nr:lysozyme-like domain-containing protein [Russula brevipes]